MEQNETELEIILVLLKQKGIHVRAIAKAVNKPHATISRVMKGLLNKNVVDFKIEGKNKVFRLKKSIEALQYVYMAEHFKVLKLFEKYPMLSVISEAILSRTSEKLVILFGSFAKFNARKNSDIDVFIETKKKKAKEQVENIDSRISVKIGKLNRKSPMIKEIIRDHIILRGVEHYYEKNKIFD